MSTPYSQISGISSYDYEDDFTSEDEQSEFSAMTNISRRTNKSDKSSTSKIPIKRSSSLRRRPDLVALGTSGPPTPSPKTSLSRQSHHLAGEGGEGSQHYQHHQHHDHNHHLAGGVIGGGSSPTLPPSSPPAPVPEPKPEEGEDLLLLTDPEVAFGRRDIQLMVTEIKIARRVQRISKKMWQQLGVGAILHLRLRPGNNN